MKEVELERQKADAAQKQAAAIEKEKKIWEKKMSQTINEKDQTI